ncbi:multidrug efflux SMR transporter [Glycomyces sp. TRM65418]|uniref:DMT family transporter n=1 Tax=Glycomyces sp. TRM65418 TaxID=2867006 RepID=UPI001CE582AD|nr:multidrug efflux SMR transporter [Glycomyces sp. TRM65418]MCC3761756.1 multidrug efflux SMR transporter [Glycomyces sp. TRM65418]QZD55841.1 multidrug efflux SMR transporter [Glycomyces sp. TRM65418]
MSWWILIAAGIVEIAWAMSIKPTAGFTRFWPTVLCVALMGLAAFLLSVAIRDLPTGTAYAVFTGIGAIGAVTLGIVLNRDPVTTGRIVAIALICCGVVLARITAPSE